MDKDRRKIEIKINLKKNIKTIIILGVVVFLVRLFFFFSIATAGSGITTNPGHPWSEVGDGSFAVNMTNLSSTRTFTFPDADATVLTTNAAVTVLQGGTGNTSFPIGAFLVGNGTSALTATSSPTVGWITATSTTASSTFANGINVTSGCFAMNGNCLTSGVSSVTNSDGTLTIAPTGGDIIASLNLTHANTWSGAQTFTALTRLNGNASTTQLSAIGKIYIGSTGTTTLVGDLGTSTFSGGIQAGLINISSTTATSTFANGINLGSGCISINGICVGSNAITSINGLNATSQTFATSSDTNLNLTIVSNGSIHTFNPVWVGTLAASRGGTGISNPTAAGVVVGSYAGGAYQQLATSSLGLLTTNVAEGNNLYYTDTRVNTYINASTTIPKTYTANTFTNANTFSGLGTFNGGLTVGSLVGPLQAQSGVVSATTSVGVTYGGTGLTTSPSNGQILIGNSSNGYTLSATSTLGVNLVDTTGTLGATRGGTGITNPTAAGILLGSYAGGTWQQLATSSLGLLTTNVNEGSNLYYTDVRVNAYINGSTTIPKTYTNNTFVGNQTLNGNVTIGTLSGPLQAQSGLVSATTSVGVTYGGTGLTSTPTYGQLLVGNSSGGYTLTATSSLGIISSAITQLGPAGQLQSGSIQTLATSSDTNIGLTITASNDTQTFTSNWIGTLAAGRGGTGISNPTAAGILLGSYAGGSYQQLATSSLGIALSNTTGILAATRGGTGLSTITNNQLLVGGPGNTVTQIATSSLGLLTTNIQEGSNQYFTDGRAQSATGFQKNGSNVTLTTASDFVGIGTSSPYAPLSVVGQVVATYFTATSTTATSTFAGPIQSSKLAVTGLASGCVQASTGGFLISTGVNCGSSSGGITSLAGQYSTGQTGATQTFATTSDTNIGLTITSTNDIHTFTPSWIGSLAAGRGGTGITNPTAAGILLGSHTPGVHGSN
jgi:hypothetical protein